jgi:hypothetical protein
MFPKRFRQIENPNGFGVHHSVPDKIACRGRQPVWNAQTVSMPLESFKIVDEDLIDGMIFERIPVHSLP